MARLLRFTQKEAGAFLRRAWRVLKTTDLDILFAPADKALGRILIVTARRTGNAPERNRARRRLRAIFHKQKMYDLGYDCGVIIKAGVNLPSAELQKLLEQAFAKIKQWHDREAKEAATKALAAPNATPKPGE